MIEVLSRLVSERGAPRFLRSDNGPEFVSKALSWIVAQGIGTALIEPGKPWQNGVSESFNGKFCDECLSLEWFRSRTEEKVIIESWRQHYNNERPHQALAMQCPAERYVPSTRPYQGLPELDYPLHDKTVTVTTCGRICFDRQKINLSQVFAGQNVGIKQVSEHIWLVTFMDYDLGYFDDETCRLEPLDNPFGPKVLPMSPE